MALNVLAYNIKRVMAIKAIREVCRAFVALCRELDLLSEASVAIDGSHHLAGLADVAELPGKLEQFNLGADDLLFGRHLSSMRQPGAA